MKAVIMAGGEGSRLRPLTCDLPKPMARLCGKPALEYILQLLQKHGVTEAAVTLRYLPHVIENHFDTGHYNGVSLRFVEENTPLGTAGGVKNAAKEFSEPFVVISGDALCDFDLTAATRAHQESGADATILVTRVGDPREYGLVSCTQDGFVSGFVEKPAWTQASTDLANTGIYLLNPKVLSLIPDDRSYDFAANLFPLMLSKGMKILAFEAKGYWCDIGDLASYLSCQRDMLTGLVQVALPPEQGQRVFSMEELPKGDYKIFPPVYLGRRVKIGEGAVIGPDVILGDGVTVGEQARIRGSAVLDDAFVGDSARLTGAVVCAGASIKKGAALFEGAVVGTTAVVGENAEILPRVSVWPGKAVAPGSRVSDNLRYGGAHPELFDDDGISGEAGVEMTPEFCARVGAAAGSLKCGSRVGVGCGEGCASKAFKSAFTAGALSTGAQVWDFGELMESQMAFGVSFCGLSAAVYITSGPKCSLKVLGEGGLAASRPLERELEGHLSRGEFVRCGWKSYRDTADMTGIRLLYQQELYRQAPKGLGGIAARVKCIHYAGERLLEDTLSRLGCDTNRGFILQLSGNGTRLSVTDVENEYISYERLMTLCCLKEFEQGRDVSLPYDAPWVIDSIAERFGRKVSRYANCPADGRDDAARKASQSQLWLRDGMMMGIRILSYLQESGQSLTELLSQVPDFSTVTADVELNASPSVVLRQLSEGESRGGEGVLIGRENGSLLIRPTKHGRALKILAEASTVEIAKDLCEQAQQKIKRHALDFAKGKE